VRDRHWSTIRAHATRLVERLAKSPVLGTVLVVVSATFIAGRWSAADLHELTDARVDWLVVSGLSYAGGVASLAMAATGRMQRSVLQPAFEAQLYKYIPGGFWQGGPWIRVGGLSLVGRYAAATVAAAVVSLALATTGVLLLACAALIIVVGIMLQPRIGWPTLARSSTLILLTVFLIAGSGAAIGFALGRDPLSMGRAVGAAWGTGVLAVPVPGGLGVREAALTLLEGAEAAPVAAMHRLVTLSTDVLLGIGAILYRSGDRSSTGPPTPP
jgi:hypothetical protein